MRSRPRILKFESLSDRRPMAGDAMATAVDTADVNQDGHVSAVDALQVINYLAIREFANGSGATDTALPVEGEEILTSGLADADQRFDVNNDSRVSALDALIIINLLEAESANDALSKPSSVLDPTRVDTVGEQFPAVFSAVEQLGSENLATADEVETLLARASMATASDDAIIAVVDRSGRILGVRVEDGVSESIKNDSDKLAFAVDGAVAKARTAAFFSSNAAPLTSRTIRFISQSTITQREVESAPLHQDPRYQGPGLVAPIGVGGHFPPEIPFTPQVDLFAIEHQSRDSQLHPGADGIKQGTTSSDDFYLTTRFNADPRFVPKLADSFFETFPESYGEQSEMSPNATPRGIATLPGGVPLFKLTSGGPNLVGGIGVFFPGPDGFATYEQGFRHSSETGRVQSEKERTNASRVLESETIAVLASAGAGFLGPSSLTRNVTALTQSLPALPSYAQLIGRIDLVGITLEIFGPHPDRSFRKPGLDRLIDVASRLGSGIDSGENIEVTPQGEKSLDGQAVPEGWLVAPHDSRSGGLSGEDVQQIIERGIAEADRTRAAIRLTKDFRPGPKTRMVFAVADTNGDLLGLYRMPDATIFSIDVSVAKARNTAYYADPQALVAADRVDHNGDELYGPFQTSIDSRDGDSLPLGTALTNRSFRFLAEPRFPTGIDNPASLAAGLVNDAELGLCDQTSACTRVGPHSSLRLPGINPITAENLVNDAPLVVDVYASSDHASTVMFDSFRVMRNFRDPGDAVVRIAGTSQLQPLANQNGVVFFPGSTPLYHNDRTILVGGFGVSGDGVDQDDVVTFAGQAGFEPLAGIRIDTYTIGGVRVPFQKFNRNPFGR